MTKRRTRKKVRLPGDLSLAHQKCEGSGLFINAYSRPPRPGYQAVLFEPLENAFTRYLSFPGFEIKDNFIRVIGADVF